MRVSLLLVVACSGPVEPPQAESPELIRERERARMKQASPPSAPLTIRWVSVRNTPPCFYFSGPDGRDDKLVGNVIADRAELEGGKVAITINGAKFHGTYEGRKLSVRRTSEHVFGGRWTATEDIVGRFDDGVLTGTYSYRECEHGNACPGNCTIDADIRFER